MGFIFVGLSNYFRVLQPGMVRQALDLVVDNVKFYRHADGFNIQSHIIEDISSSLAFFAVSIILLAALMGVFMYCMRQTIIVMSRLIEYDIRKELYVHFQDMDQGYFRKNFTGDLMSRVSEDVSKVRMYLGPAILYGINLFFLVIMVIFAMFQVNSTLSLYTLAPLPILSLSIYFVSTLIHKKSYEIQMQLSKLTSVSQEVYSGIKVVKSYVQERSMQEYFESESEHFKKKSLDLARINALFFPLMLLLIGASTVFVIFIGGREAISGNISPGNIAEFIIYLNMLTWPVTSIGWVASIIQQASASQKRINEVLDTTSKLNKKGNKIDAIKGSVQFDEVSFTYEDTGIKALDKISFSIEPGQKLAIVGKTASGKTTLADLLLRMYDPDSGIVSIDDIDIKQFDINHLRDSIGYVPQDVFLFSDTVRHNVSFSRPESSQDQVERATSMASVHQDILELSDGYDTVIGERGVMLSGGQKQRLSIARAMIKKPSIVILDDCLSAVDGKTESRILDYLQDELKDKTAVIITHRIPKHFKFDHIIVLDEGSLVEEGTHEQLMKIGGVYKGLIRKQQLQDEEISI